MLEIYDFEDNKKMELIFQELSKNCLQNLNKLKIADLIKMCQILMENAKMYHSNIEKYVLESIKTNIDQMTEVSKARITSGLQSK